MTTSRRSFVRGITLGSVALPMFRADAFARLAEANAIAGTASPEEVAQGDEYWTQIQKAFDADRTMINLNNGGISPTPSHVLEQMIRDLKFTNELPVEHMWRILQPRMETTRRELAKEFGCDTEEMAVVRNASEAMEIMIYGLDLQRGDEVVITNQNYGRMMTTWDQRARREGIVVKKISFKVPPPSPSYLVEQFRAAITPRTKVIEYPHITNLSGQVMPVREVMRLARPLGIEVFIDGAHAFGHWPMKRDELECDFYGTSLHKWLHAPIGAGFLYVRREKIPKLWPLMAAETKLTSDIRKYEEIGTHPQANFNAVSAALAFTQGMGLDRKVARLRYLRDRWAKRLLAESDRVHVLTELGPDKAGAIGLFNVDGIESAKLGEWLMARHRIVNVVINHAEFNGLRITPNVYTTLNEVDTFSDAVLKAIRQGIV